MEGMHYFEPVDPPIWQVKPRRHGALWATLIFGVVFVVTFGAILTLDYAGLGSYDLSILAETAAL